MLLLNSCGCPPSGYRYPGFQFNASIPRVHTGYNRERTTMGIPVEKKDSIILVLALARLLSADLSMTVLTSKKPVYKKKGSKLVPGLDRIIYP